MSERSERIIEDHGLGAAAALAAGAESWSERSERSVEHHGLGAAAVSETEDAVA